MSVRLSNVSEDEILSFKVKGVAMIDFYQDQESEVIILDCVTAFVESPLSKKSEDDMQDIDEESDGEDEDDTHGHIKPS